MTIFSSLLSVVLLSTNVTSTYSENFQNQKDSTPSFYSTSNKDQKVADSLTTSRFVLVSDKSVDSVYGIKLPNHWWSRPHEYAWAMEFAGPDYVVLDAACGISHPFKWYLGKTCKETWACDSDSRISKIAQLVQETNDDLGPDAFNTIMSEMPWQRVHLVNMSICDLSNDLPKFDRVFCISTLEHMTAQDREKALAEFAKVLKPDGWIVLTADYPVVTPQALLESASKVGLVPVGAVDLNMPKTGALQDPSWHIYRCVLKKSNNS